MKRNIDTLLKNESLSPRPRKAPSITTPRVSRMDPPRIELNDQEQRLRHLLLDAVKGPESNGSGKPPASPTLRWAGGWVRDKLLGIPSNDIDVAIDTMTGVDFLRKLHDYCLTPAAARVHGINPNDIGKQYMVARNPDRSKHLETASVKIFGLDLDFVNLRKETYADDSRNPQMEFGTAQEDALRRDATVNALFYNLNKDEVEDFTGGIKDMKKIPDAIFVVDPKKERICIQEAHTLGIPLIGIADTNCDPEELDFVIPGNDDAIRAVKLIVAKMADAVIEANQGVQLTDSTDEVAEEAIEE